MTLTLDKDGIPVAPITLDGFPTCKRGDKREVNPGQDFCALHGGTPLTGEALRRAIHRSIRGPIYEMMKCRECDGIALTDLRCKECAWLRGNAMGTAGIAEEMGLYQEVKPLLQIIARLDPSKE